MIRLIRDENVTTFAGNGAGSLLDCKTNLLDCCLHGPMSIRFSVLGNLIISDTLNNSIRKIVHGKLVTLAGGKLGAKDRPASAAQFYEPTDAIQVGNGDVIIADRGNHRVRLRRRGIVSTMAGFGPNIINKGELYPLNLHFPSWLGMNKNDLIIADSGQSRFVITSQPSLSGLYDTNWIAKESTLPKGALMVDRQWLEAHALPSALLQRNLPIVLAIRNYMFHPSSLSSHFLQWMMTSIQVTNSFNVDTTNTLLKTASEVGYIKLPTSKLACPVSILSLSNHLIAQNMIPCGSCNAYNVVISNNDPKLTMEWNYLKDPQSEFEFSHNAIFFAWPTKGQLAPKQSVQLIIIVVLLRPTSFIRFIRLSATTGYPSLSYHALSVQLTSSNEFSSQVESTSNHEESPLIPRYWSIDYRMLVEIGKIASGASGSVFKGELFGKPVAMKRWTLGPNDLPPEEFTKELQIMIEYKHCNLLKLVGAVSCLGHAVLVTELASGGSLDKWLRNTSTSEKNWSTKLDLAHGAASGILYLNQRNVIHHDIKSLNLLITDELVCQVADFGTTRQAATQLTQGVGSIDWMAPETCTSQQYTIKSDVFSFGLVLYELILESTPSRAFDEVLKGQIGKIPVDFEAAAPVYCSLLHRCCAVNPFERPDFTEICAILSVLKYHGINYRPSKSRERSNAVAWMYPPNR